ncbi:DUF488 domain-containing protein [Nitrospiraceae bacterium AH_259_D15_M11_P09]|nr:DUF488 domain-containing protein [Nitrospiraceae bacterium AH_259_D15_M11_P09]
MTQVIWTVGHSTRSIEDFIQLLQAHGIRVLVDVRAIPYSRRNPQFNTDMLAATLKEAGMQYHSLPVLGGRRKSRKDSTNLGWRSPGFRGYADYMQTGPFREALEGLMVRAQAEPTAIMCAEAVPWRCHRSLIADALVSRGWAVQHILTTAKADQHALTSFAKLQNGTLTYPAPEASVQASSLF